MDTDQWEGRTQAQSFHKNIAALRHSLADAAKLFNWNEVLKIINDQPSLINATRPDGQSLYTPLHQAAYGNAPLTVVKQLINNGAWRTLRNSDGKRAVDIARQKGHFELIHWLEPEYKTEVPLSTLLGVQSHFHEIINGRSIQLVEKHKLRLPELEPMLELENPEMWFPVPGMYGGFNYKLVVWDSDVILLSKSWSRVVGGSGQFHVITSQGVKLIDEDFVQGVFGLGILS